MPKIQRACCCRFPIDRPAAETGSAETGSYVKFWKRCWFAALLGLLTAWGVASRPVAAGTERPNIVVILADDLGYGDVHCYNPDHGKLQTPHIDRLAAEGMRFTDAHSSSGVCSPSRYTLLTGRYHWRTRLQAGIVQYLERPLIPPERLTVAGMLRQHGYHTACFGKWHLGWEWDIPGEQVDLFAPDKRETLEATELHRQAWGERFSRTIGGGPTERGFDEYFGTDVPNWPPFCFIEQDRTLGIPQEFLPGHLFENHLASKQGPALRDWDLRGILPTTVDRACDYVHRRARMETPFFLYLSLTSPHTPLAVNEPWQGKSGLNSAAADLILETDAAVGRVLEALDDAGVSEKTWVLFTSDNGFAPYVGAKDLEAQGHHPSGPWRGYKADAWEGGHRVAFIVRWPPVAAAGSVCRELVHHADLMATLAEMIGEPLPPDAGEDSFSLVPILKGSAEPVREDAVSCGSQGLLALRHGSWKMLFGKGGGGAWSSLSETPRSDHPAQLYDLQQDIAETTNLYAARPEIAQRMTERMERLIRRGRSTPGPDQANDVPVSWPGQTPARSPAP